MIDRTQIYNIIYALAAKDGREERLFGTCAEPAYVALVHSLAGDAFPELWFEIPLLGDPWFDLHALTAREGLHPGMEFAPETCGGFPEAFEWFASQNESVRQLALSWDVGSGSIDQPAVQLLLNRRDPRRTCDFLTAAGRPDAAPAYRAFYEKLPEAWFPCYSGVFPSRPDHNLRVECVFERPLQQAYADDASLLERHLRQVGLDDLGDTIVPRCQALARTPFAMEFQFDVDEAGSATPVFSASLRFSTPPGTDEWHCFDPNAHAGTLMRQVEEWGLADDRWHDLAGTIFAKRLARGDDQMTLYCYPAFLKLRWRDGNPVDAKSYLIAGVQ